MNGYSSITEQLQDYIDMIYETQKCREHIKDNDLALEEAAAAFHEDWERIRQKERETELLLPAVYLKECYQLSELEYWLIMLAYIYEAEAGICLEYRQKYGQQIPDFQYGIHLLSYVIPTDCKILALLSDSRHTLWEIFLPQPCAEQQMVLAQPMLLRREAVYFLSCGNILLPQGVGSYLQCKEEERTLLYKETYEKIKQTLAEPFPLHIILHGRTGTGKKTLLGQLCRDLQVTGILWEVPEIYRRERDEQEMIWKAILFTARLVPCIMVMNCRGIGKEEAEAEWLEQRKREYLSQTYTIYLVEEERVRRNLGQYTDIALSLPDFISGSQKAQLLDIYIPKQYRREWQDEITGRYRFSAGNLCERLRRIKEAARLEGIQIDDKALWGMVLKEGEKNHTLGEIMGAPYALEDFVGNEESLEQLNMIIKLAGNWRRTIESWNQAGGSYPEGLLILFHGSSGTGKTMSASILAAEIDMPVLRVNLSSIYDKYIGETEKHLDEIFHTAERNNCILFFDEADALFSKRIKVEDSRDKYANISTSYLLQRIETYMGIIVLATNLIHHFDDAFLRRIRFVVKFQPLNAQGRERLWRQTLSGPRKVAGTVSMSMLSEAAPLSPARIKTSAMVAQMLAELEGAEYITEKHLMQAIRMEAGKDDTLVKAIM